MPPKRSVSTSVSRHVSSSPEPQSSQTSTPKARRKRQRKSTQSEEREPNDAVNGEANPPANAELIKEAEEILKELAKSVFSDDEEQGRKKLVETLKRLKKRYESRKQHKKLVEKTNKSVSSISTFNPFDSAFHVEPLSSSMAHNVDSTLDANGIPLEATPVEMVELPNYHCPWLKPIAPSSSDVGEALPEMDFIPQTFLASRIVNSKAFGPAKEMPVVEKLPVYFAWSPLPRNEVAEVEKVFSSVPALEFIKDNDSKWLKDYAKGFPVEGVDLRRMKTLLLTPRWIITVVERLNEKLRKSLASEESSNGSEISEKVFEAISEAYGMQMETPAGIQQRYLKAIGQPTQNFLSYSNNTNGKAVPSVTRFLDSCTRLLCNRCFRYDCLEHPFRTTRTPQVFPMTPPEAADKPCGEHCHLQKKTEKRNARPLSTYDQVILKTFMTEGDEDPGRQTYCDMALCINRRCDDTHRLIQQLLEQPEEAEEVEESSNNTRPGRRRGQRKVSRIGGAAAVKAMRKDLKDEGAVKQYQYIPCQHGGGTHCNQRDHKDVCSCVDRGTFCERFCDCDAKCENRFPGCKCTGDCRGKRCPCFVARRECDPELCKCAFESSKDRCQCKNTPILFNAKRKVKCGPSDVHGWGAFIMEDTKAGDFICEYTGEVITQEEAERRGRLYDKIKVSYLFDLNLEYVVDAARKGNKIRYANHSSKNPNCVPEIYRVQGDNRIGIFAKRDMKAGEELFFDYSYTAEALKFVQIEPSAKPASRLNVFDPREESKAQNADPRFQRQTVPSTSLPLSPSKERPTLTLKETFLKILATKASMSFGDDEKEVSQRQLEVILKDVDLVEPLVLKAFKGGQAVSGGGGVDGVYREKFGKFGDRCPKGFEGGKDVWAQMSELANIAEQLAVKESREVVVNGNGMENGRVNGEKKKGSVKKEPMVNGRR
ncbi:hypothetical protein RvY_06606 [Ramazzottius varieornatus]|uniref:[histone H3]-lysine(27) N-trimethyltransferase n=1 Tax=Ramazzottius varieornatus TaxID=947166 RepID=A0A1D1V5E2_RAMVA|nr:hypothetical protein RvY_06606 [Ramazzottius varieornatus]